MEYDKLVEKIMQGFKEKTYLDASSIPNIDLYMDQVTTFMDDHLELFKRSEDDKTLTKTMINNYSKFHLLPPTNKKKYSKDHILLLLFIFYLKPSLSIPDIGSTLKPIQELLLDKNFPVSLEEYFDTLSRTQAEHFDSFSQQVINTVKLSQELFNDLSNKDNELLSVISIIYMLSLQASMQKSIATHLIDNYLKPLEQAKEKESKKEKPKKAHK